MRYNVMNLRAVWDGSTYVRDIEWGLADVGLSRHTATAQMIMRAMRVNETQGTIFLASVLSGADPEEPYLIADDDDIVRLWFCIVPDGQEPPSVADH